MITFDFTLLRVKLQKEGRHTLWEHIESCLFRSKAAQYHLSSITRKLQEVKDWPNHEKEMFYVFEIEWEIGYEVDALMLTLHSLIDITAQVTGTTMNYEMKTKDSWKELKKKGIPDHFKSLIDAYRGGPHWQTITNYSAVTKHVNNIGGTLHLDYSEEEVKARFETDPLADRQLPSLDIVPKSLELIDFAEEFVAKILRLVTIRLWPKSKENFDTPSWSVLKQI